MYNIIIIQNKLDMCQKTDKLNNIIRRRDKLSAIYLSIKFVILYSTNVKWSLILFMYFIISSRVIEVRKIESFT